MRLGCLRAALLGAATFAATPAAALDDLTGVWEGTAVCDRTDDTGSSRGRIGGPSCGFSELIGGSLIQALVKAKPGSEKAST